jgi:hypothetical protein
MSQVIYCRLSYRQTAAAYQNGGGAYVVAKDNFGAHVAVWAAVALLDFMELLIVDCQYVTAIKV